MARREAVAGRGVCSITRGYQKAISCLMILHLGPGAMLSSGACSRWRQNGEPPPSSLHRYFLFSSLLTLKDSLRQRARRCSQKKEALRRPARYVIDRGLRCGQPITAFRFRFSGSFHRPIPIPNHFHARSEKLDLSFHGDGSRPAMSPSLTSGGSLEKDNGAWYKSIGQGT
jgi:hypothetical protein